MSVAFQEDNFVADVCKGCYYEFFKEMWETVNPEPLVLNWHLEFLCEEIQIVCERMFRGLPKLYDLVINISPGTSKSSAASVFLTPWLWTRMPHCRSINGSHTQELVLDLSRKSRDVVVSTHYQELFPEIMLREDQNTKAYFCNTRGGNRFSCTIGGKTPTGMHAHIHVVDDPIDPAKAMSDIETNVSNVWLDETLSTRKVDKAVTPLILIMQRLAQNDCSGYMLSKKGRRIRHINIPAMYTNRVSPPEIARFYKNSLMDPVRLSREVLEEYKQQGDYFYCTPGFTPILMSDWTEKSIERIEVGDSIVGYLLGQNLGKGRRSCIVPAVVMAKSVSQQSVIKITMGSGRVIYCTPDHKWWTRKTNHTETYRKLYVPAKVGRPLYSVYKPLPILTDKEKSLYNWLGGMIDGDGTVSGAQVSITQSPSANPKVFKRIGKVLRELDLPYHLDVRDGCVKDILGREEFFGTKGQFTISGGRYSKMKLVNFCYMVKKDRVLQAIWDRSGFVSEEKDKVVSIEDVGEMTVYGLTTTTGNYVAWGYASQNSGQFLQDPVPPGGGMFKTDRIKSEHTAPGFADFRKLVRYWDKAGSSKKGAAWTVGVLMGVTKDIIPQYWILDVIRFREESASRESRIKSTAIKDGTMVWVGIEQEGGSGGKESAENTIARLGGFKCKINIPRGDKEWRADPFSSQVNASNVHMLEGEWTKDYIEELKHFPHSRFKDQVDASSGAFSLLFRLRRRVGAF